MANVIQRILCFSWVSDGQFDWWFGHWKSHKALLLLRSMCISPRLLAFGGTWKKKYQKRHLEYHWRKVNIEFDQWQAHIRDYIVMYISHVASQKQSSTGPVSWKRGIGHRIICRFTESWTMSSQVLVKLQKKTFMWLSRIYLKLTLEGVDRILSVQSWASFY